MGRITFSDSLAGQIANRIGQSGKLRVAAYRAAAQSMADEDVRRIGERLHVDLVLEGAVQFRGDSIAVATQLFDAHTGVRIWGREFDSPAVEALALQEEISSSLAGALRLADSRPAVPPAVPGWSHDREALDLYSQAHHLFDSRKPENLWKSVALYRAALQKDPRFAMAYIGLAKDYVVLGTNEDQDLSQTRPLAQQAEARALAIDPNLPDALLTEAATADYRDFASLERSYRAAVAANPDNVDAHHWWGLNLLAAGRFTEAEAETAPGTVARSAVRIYSYPHRNRCTTAAAATRIRSTRNARFWLSTRINLAHWRSKPAVTRESVDTRTPRPFSKTCSRPPVPRTPWPIWGMSMPPPAKRIRPAICSRHLSNMAKTRHVSPHYLALVQTGLGKKNEAIALLDLSLEQHDAPLALLNVDPRWDPLRGDPRFQQLLHALCVGR